MHVGAGCITTTKDSQAIAKGKGYVGDTLSPRTSTLSQGLQALH